MTEVEHGSVPKYAHDDWALWVHGSGDEDLVRVRSMSQDGTGKWIYSIGLEPNEESGLTEGGYLSNVEEEHLTSPTRADDLLLAATCDLVLLVARLEEELGNAKSDLAAVNRVRKLVL